jgi:hypothetical protein
MKTYFIILSNAGVFSDTPTIAIVHSVPEFI